MTLSNSLSDTTMKPGLCTSSTRPTPWDGQVIYESNTKNIRWRVPAPAGWVLADGPVVSFAPTISNITVGVGGSSVGEYQLSDGYCTCRYQVVLGSSGFSVGFCIIALPFSALLTNIEVESNWVLFYDASTGNRVVGSVHRTGSGGAALRALDTSSTYTSLVGISSTSPFTWASGDTIIASLRYPMASKIY